MYELYKPLRNFLRPFNLWSGLGTTYFYMQYLIFEKQLPNQLLTPDLRNGASNLKAGLFGWLVELMARELILNAEHRSGKPFASAQVAFRTMHDIHRLDDRSWGAHPSRSDDIILQLSRIAFKQFPWQSPLTNGVLARYHKLYAFPPVARIVETEFGMSVGELFQLILLLMEELMRRPTLAFEFLPAADPSIVEPVRALSDRLSRSSTELRAMMIERQSFDVNWAYTFNPLREYPLVHAGNDRSTICPAPPILIQRLTDGLFFDLIRADKSFGDAIGHAFEAYVGEVAEAIVGEAFVLQPEMRYGRSEKRSVDWIMSDTSASMFVECKLARLDVTSQTEITTEEPFAAAIGRLGKNIAQLYASLSDALAGRYPHWQADGRPIFPGVVTFYNWFAFGPFFYKHLDSAVERAFRERGLDPELLDRYPFFLCSIDEFEGLITACGESSIASVVAAKNAPEHRHWLMRGFLGDYYPGCLSNAWGTFEDGLDVAIDGPSRFTRRS